MEKITIKTMAEIVRLRSALDNIGQASYQYHILKKKFPLEYLEKEDDGKELCKLLQDILNNVINLSTPYARPNS